ncbi:hypothetical protein [Nocardioides euryhalodurans]|uniref:Uncharacterized protein n=1 Tax=Nocardioides euryhalodurans TaxID=2518370 RepID=A0A4P7GPC2_9ACTN|nr:hypothetical protein [Nocardioides euryhalodurans]QBR93814.1 hypothetical protein EXE57_17160 [Nocardioides euryhalodurans]
MTWNAFHSRGEILRAVTVAADARRDGSLPLDVDGVRHVFADELELLGALQLRWHTRLAGRIERELMSQPLDLEAAVVRAWQQTAEDLPGIRAIIDQHRAHPLDDAMAEAMGTATAKEHTLLAVMAGRAGTLDTGAAAVGAAIEGRARATRRPGRSPRHLGNPRLLDRIRAVLAA